MHLQRLSLINLLVLKRVRGGLVFDTSYSCCLLILNLSENQHASFLRRLVCGKFVHVLHDNIITYSGSPMCLTAKQDLKPRLVSSQSFQNQYANLTFSTSIEFKKVATSEKHHLGSLAHFNLISPCGWCILTTC